MLSNFMQDMIALHFYHPMLLWLIPIAFLVAVIIYLFKVRSLIIMLIRAACISSLILALSEPYLSKTVSRKNFYVLFDVSKSIGQSAQEAMINFLTEVLSKNTNKVSLYPFARDLSKRPITLESTIDKSELAKKLQDQESKLNPTSSNISSAINNILGKEDISSILLLSDGKNSEGSLMQAASSAASRNISIYPLIPDNSYFISHGLSIVQLHAPVTAKASDLVEVLCTVRNSSDKTQSSTLEIQLDSQKLLSARVEIPANQEKLFLLKTPPLKGGLQKIEARLTSENNFKQSLTRSMHRWISAKEKQKLLLLSGDKEDQQAIKELLTIKGYSLEDIVLDREKNIPESINDYAGIIINNAGLKQLPKSFPDKLKIYAQTGGGVLLIGGDKSFGLGGYIDTPIEEISPLKFSPPKAEKKRLISAIVMIIDKSRSMDEEAKIEGAREAAITSINSLKEEDWVSVIGFDSAPFVVIDMKKVADAKLQADSRIGRLTPDGNTNLLPALGLARQKLSAVDASRKHIIVLSDGIFPLSSTAYIDEINQVREDGITVTSIALGVNADVPFMKLLSQYGKGAFYHTLDPSRLPQIFIQDINQATGEKTLAENENFSVGVGPGGITSTSIDRYPVLLGFVETLPKKGSILELITKRQQEVFPILASWNYEKGKVIAFTSDANGRWSQEWMNWDNYSKFWGEIIETLRARDVNKSKEVDFDLRYKINNKTLELDLSIFDERLINSPAPVTSADIHIDNNNEKIYFIETKKGRFKAVVNEIKAKDYKLDISYGELKLPTTAISISENDLNEEPGQGLDIKNLEDAAYYSGGSINPSLEQISSKEKTTETKTVFFAPFLLLAMILLVTEALLRERY